METLVRNATLRFSRRVECYEPLKPTAADGNDDVSHQLQVSISRPKSCREHKNGDMNIFARAKSQRNHEHLRKSMFSRPKSYRKNQDSNNNNMMMMNSLSYKNRRDRARKRQIFLQSYKLTSMEKTSRLYSKTKNLKRVVVVKVKSMVVSLLSPLRSCNSRSAINAALPVPTTVVSCC